MRKLGGLKKLILTNVLFLLLVGLIALGVIFALEYNYSYKSLKERLFSTTEKFAEDFDNDMTRVDKISQALFLSEEFQTAVKNLDADDNEEYYARIDNYFYSYAAIDVNIKGITYFPVPDDYYAGEVISYGEVVSKDFYEEIVAEIQAIKNAQMCIIEVEGGEDKLFFLCRRILDMSADSYYNDLGIGCITLRQSSFVNLQNIADVVDGFAYEIYNENGLFLASSNHIEKNKGLKYTIPLSIEGWTFIGYQNTGVLNGSLNSGIFSVALISLITIAIFVLFSVILNLRNTRAYKYLIDSFTHIREEKIDVKVNYTNDENVNKVIQSYNLMIDEIERINHALVEEQAKTLAVEIEKSSYELKVLNSQINKHFLFNILSTLRSIIFIGEKEKAVECINKLSLFLRYSLDQNEKINIAQEIEFLRCYVYMQSLRFGDIHFELDIPETLQEREIPRMILQPIVENAFSHGRLTSGKKIRIRAREKEGRITFFVSDNGTGVSRKRQAEVNENLRNNRYDEKSGGSGIALVNVQRRIRFFVTDDSYIKIRSIQEKGTVVTVKL